MPPARFSTSSRLRLRPRPGFTILELVIVLLIMGVMAQLSLGRIVALMNQQRVLHAATAIQNDLEAAFQIAGRNRRPVRVVWSSATQQLVIRDRAGMFFRRVNVGTAYGLKPNDVTMSTTPLEVYPNGLASDTLLITISSNGVTKKLHLSRAGLVEHR